VIDPRDFGLDNLPLGIASHGDGRPRPVVAFADGVIDLDGLVGAKLLDEQTLRGKVVDGVAELARAAHVPVIAFGGSVDLAVEAELRVRGVRCAPIAPGPMSLEEAMRDAGANLRAAAARVAGFLSGG